MTSKPLKNLSDNPTTDGANLGLINMDPPPPDNFHEHQQHALQQLRGSVSQNGAGSSVAMIANSDSDCAPSIGVSSPPTTMEQSHIMDSTAMVLEQTGASEQDGAHVVRDDTLPQLDVPDVADHLVDEGGPIGALVQLQVEELHDASHVQSVSNDAVLSIILEPCRESRSRPCSQT